MSQVITTTQESPIWVSNGRDDLLAIMTRPQTPRDLGVVLLTGGGWMPSTHRNRMYVDLARELALLGCYVARFDYPGVGDSTGVTRVFDSMSPHVAETLSVVKALRATGVSQIVLVGTCYGGRTALATAGLVPDLAGLALSASPVKDYGASDRSLGWHARKAWSARTLKRIPARYPKYLRILKANLRRAVTNVGTGRPDPVSQRYFDGLAGVLSRNVPVLMLHGLHDKHYPSYLAAMEGRLGRLLADHDELVTTVELEGELHGELWPESQAFTRDQVAKFVQGLLEER